jgi:hypothetical protein
MDPRDLLISIATAALKAAETDAAKCAHFPITIQDTCYSRLIARAPEQLIFRPEWRPTPRPRPRPQNYTDQAPDDPEYALFDSLIA